MGVWSTEESQCMPSLKMLLGSEDQHVWGRGLRMGSLPAEACLDAQAAGVWRLSDLERVPTSADI